MKRSCKNVDICNPDVIFPWVLDCCTRHKKRYDFRKMFVEHGMTNSEYKRMLETRDVSSLLPVVAAICRDAAERIRTRELNLRTVVIRERTDKTTGKLRQIGDESAMQQVLDYIAVGSAGEIFRRRIVDDQVSSIKGRGQIFGVKRIQKWIRADNRAAEYARKHGLSYTASCKYFVKLDIKVCYPTASAEIFMKLFRRDCGNQDIIWLWETLLWSHRVSGYRGFMIGALPSQWGCQYMISFIYRYARSFATVRRGKRIPAVRHMLAFMDDMLLIGSNRSALKSAVRKIIRYAREEFGWEIKPSWSIRSINECPIDMMGYVVHADGHITIRGRNFVHSRRLALRLHRSGRIGLCRAKRLVSFKGFYKHSDSFSVAKSLNLASLFRSASHVVSRWSRRVAQPV